MLVNRTEEQVKRDARIAFFEVVERISPIKLSLDFYGEDLSDLDFDSIKAFEKEIDALKFRFATSEEI